MNCYMIVTGVLMLAAVYCWILPPWEEEAREVAIVIAALLGPMVVGVAGIYIIIRGCGIK